MDIISGLIFAASCLMSSQPEAFGSCGPSGLAGIEPGNKIVSLSVRKGLFRSFVQDDDGFLVAHLAIAHCARGAGMGLALPPEKAQCISTSQRDVLSTEALSSFQFSPKDKDKTASLEKVRAVCGFDYIEAWNDVKSTRDNQTFACDEMKSVIEKAAARSKEYLKEQLDPANLATVDDPKATIDGYIAELKSSDAALQAIASYFKMPRKAGEFYSLSETFKERAKSRVYQVTDVATSEIKPELQKPFAEVSELLNIDFPSPYAPPRRPVRVGTTRCGGAPLPTVPEALAGLEWRERGSVVQPIGERPVKPTSGGSK